MDFEKIGVFGGSFDPIHNGHLAMARGFARQFGLSRVLIIPVSSPPHKSGAGQASPGHRLEMCRIACEDDPVLTVSDMEIRRPAPSYTSDTLRELKIKYPGVRLYLLCGADMFETVLSWNKSGFILENAVICMMPRGALDASGYERHARILRERGGETALCSLPKIEISSTMVRQAAAEGKNLHAFVPRPVEDYIYRHALYGAPSSEIR